MWVFYDWLLSLGIILKLTFFKLNDFYRNYYKGHMDKIKGEGGGGGGRWVQLGSDGGMGRKGIQL